MNNSSNTVSNEDIIEMTLTWSLSLSGIILNSVQLIMLYRFRRTSTNNHVYLISLSLSDLHVVLVKPVMLTLHIVGIHNIQLETQTEKIGMSYLIMTVYNSLCHYVFITLDRLLAVSRPFWYRVTITRKICVYTCLLIWSVSILFAILRATAMNVIDKPLIYKLQCVTSSIMISCGIFYLICYSVILKIVFRRRAIKTTLEHSQQSKISDWTLSTSEKHTLKISAGITISYMILNFPTAISYFFEVADYQKWLRLCFLMNCSVDSIIYFFLHN